jgi:hypothetical protein
MFIYVDFWTRLNTLNRKMPYLRVLLKGGTTWPQEGGCLIGKVDVYPIIYSKFRNSTWSKIKTFNSSNLPCLDKIWFRPRNN